MRHTSWDTHDALRFTLYFPHFRKEHQMYKVGIIGLGSIAARYSKPSDPYPYCHTGGIRFCESTELVAVADLSQERRDEFKETWGPGVPS